MPNRIEGVFRRKSPPPCERDCADRCVGCHSKCERYIDWKAKEDRLKSVYDEARKDEKVIGDYVVERVIKNKEMFAERKMARK